MIKDRLCGSRNERSRLPDWLEFLKRAAAKSNMDFGVGLEEGKDRTRESEMNKGKLVLGSLVLNLSLSSLTY